MKILKISILLIICCVALLSFNLEVCKPTKVDELKKYQVKGIDVSHHQGTIDWESVKDNDIDFCFIKATEGVNFVDKKFIYNLSESKKNKIFAGAYHYFRFGKDIKLQFENFKKTVPKDLIDLPPVVDVEYYNNKSLHNKKNQKKFLSDLNRFLLLIESHYKVKPIIYTDIKFYSDLLKDEINYPLWMSDLHTKNLNYLDSSQWFFWQYSFVGQVKGIKKSVDLNVFNGNLEKLKDLKNPEN